MIALITPTGGRPEQIKICASLMHRQDYQGDVFWVIVDDCDPVTSDCVRDDFKQGWEIVKIYPKPSWRQGMNTQSRNMIEAIKAVQSKQSQLEAVFIIEDDDYYKPNYLSEMMRHLQGFDVAGESHTVYYNVNKDLVFFNQNTMHVSLFQVAFRPSLLEAFLQICKRAPLFIDTRFFKVVRTMKVRINIFKDSNLAIGIKGMPGRTGIGFGHKMGSGRYDLNRMQKGSIDILKGLIGDDYKLYYN